MKYVYCTLAIFVPVFMAGCGERLVPMSGRVTYSDDGGPLETGTVVFAAADFQASGTIRPDGRYTLGTDGTSKGLRPGAYRIYVVGAERPEGRDSQGAELTVPTIAPKFTNPATSELSLDVDSSTRRYDFQVDRFSARKK